MTTHKRASNGHGHRDRKHQHTAVDPVNSPEYVCDTRTRASVHEKHILPNLLVATVRIKKATEYYGPEYTHVNTVYMPEDGIVVIHPT